MTECTAFSHDLYVRIIIVYNIHYTYYYVVGSIINNQCNLSNEFNKHKENAIICIQITGLLYYGVTFYRLTLIILKNMYLYVLSIF